MILGRIDAITIHKWVPSGWAGEWALTHVAGRRAPEAVEKKGLLWPAELTLPQPHPRPGTRRNATDQSRQERSRALRHRCDGGTVTSHGGGLWAPAP